MSERLCQDICPFKPELSCRLDKGHTMNHYAYLEDTTGETSYQMYGAYWPNNEPKYSDADDFLAYLTGEEANGI